MSTKITRNRDVAWRILEERLIAVTPHDSAIHRFNPSATFLWTELDGRGKTRLELADALAGRFGLGQKAALKDTDAFLTKAYAGRLLTPPTPSV